MPLVVIGISHKTAPPEVRDRHAFPTARIAEALSALHDYNAVREAAILATCNRLEIYADVGEFEAGVSGLKEFLTTYRRMRVEDFDQYLYTMLGAEAIAQLFGVAAGLESMLIGEDEIVSQVKDALATASRSATAGPHLHRLFRTALRVAKRVRTETAISRDVVSLGSAAVELAARRRGLGDVSAIVVGAGRMGATVARHLAAKGAARIAIVNRTREKAEALAAEVGGEAKNSADLPALLRGADVLISAVGSGDYILSAAVVRAAMEGRAGRPLLVIDVAAPRDVDPAAAAIDGVSVHELQDLRQIVEENLESRRASIPAARAIVDDETRGYLRWYQSRAAVPLIAELRDRAEAIRLAEIDRLFASHPELDSMQRDAVVAASTSIVNRLLHAPLTKLRESMEVADRVAEADVLEKLLDLAELEGQIERQFAQALRPPT